MTYFLGHFATIFPKQKNSESRRQGWATALLSPTTMKAFSLCCASVALVAAQESKESVAKRDTAFTAA